MGTKSEKIAAARAFAAHGIDRPNGRAARLDAVRKRERSKDGAGGAWCILRTKGNRTLALARSLARAGFDVWTPQEIKLWRRPRSHITTEREMAIMPTFVFARAEQVVDLIHASADPVSPHPSFHVFIHAGRAGAIVDAELTQIRRIEADAAERHAAWVAEQKRLVGMAEAKAERERRRRHVQQGEQVKVDDPSFLGLTGTVKAGGDRYARVELNNGITMRIGTWLLLPDDVTTRPSSEDKAARAA